MKLRNMNASVNHVPRISVQTASGEIVDLKNAYVLTSYNSRVAIYGKDKNGAYRVYLLPRYEYSVTIWKHIHAFIQDYCDFVHDECAKTMRQYAKLGVTYDGYDYCLCNGIRYNMILNSVCHEYIAFW